MVASSYGKAWAIEYEDLDGMARAYCFASTNGDNATTMLSRRLEALQRFDCDGTIYHVNRSCKVMDCQMMEVQRQLSEMAGVPFTSFLTETRRTTATTARPSSRHGSRDWWRL